MSSLEPTIGNDVVRCAEKVLNDSSQWRADIERIRDRWLDIQDEQVIAGAVIGIFYVHTTADVAGPMTHLLGGDWEKSSENGTLRLRRRYGSLSIDINVTDRECERQKVGTRKENRVVADPPTEVVEVDVYETVCPPLHGGEPEPI